MIGTWCLTYLLFKGGAAGRASVEATSAFRLVIPAYPAFVVLLVAGAFAVVSGATLLPWLPRRVPIPATLAPPTRVTLVAAVVLAVYPFAAVVTATGWTTGRVVLDSTANTLVPVSNELRAVAVVEPDRVRLSWDSPEHGSSRVFYVVLRVDGPADCTERTEGARDCVLIAARPAGYTRRTRFLDIERRVTDVTYRIGMLAGWAGDLGNSDLLMVGPPLHVPLKGNPSE